MTDAMEFSPQELEARMKIFQARANHAEIRVLQLERQLASGNLKRESEMFTNDQLIAILNGPFVPETYFGCSAELSRLADKELCRRLEQIKETV